MKNTKWFVSNAMHWVCLAGVLVGCGSIGTYGEMAEDDSGHHGQTRKKTTNHEPVDFTTHMPEACVSGCVGGVGDTICQAEENNFNCAQDCACGDGKCDGSETIQNCPGDCKYKTDPSWTDDFCGNQRCEPWEYDGVGLECEIDCHVLPDPVGTVCGDHQCEIGETTATCAADCGSKVTCGNQVCEPEYGETFATCQSDCPNTSVPAGRFVGAHCNGYALYSSYADGNGGVVDHLVTNLAAGCDGTASGTSYPWRVVSNVNTCNGSTLQKPDGSICTISNAYCSNDGSWATLGTDYVMDKNPNDYEMFQTYKGSFQPMEWAKVGTKMCSMTNSCLVYDYQGNSTSKTSSSYGVWRPQIGRWSKYEKSCN